MMPAPQPTDYRESAIQECDKLIKYFDERARRHKRSFVRYKNSSIALTCGVTDSQLYRASTSQRSLGRRFYRW
jgi:hypothetical protein